MKTRIIYTSILLFLVGVIIMQEIRLNGVVASFNAALSKQSDKMEKSRNELNKASSELSRLNRVSAEEEAYVISIKNKAKKLRDFLRENPKLDIPEMALLTNTDWAEVLETTTINDELDVRSSLSQLRIAAKRKMGKALLDGIISYVGANGGKLPHGYNDITPFITNPIVVNALSRYEFAKQDAPAEFMEKKILISESISLEEVFDSRLQVWADGSSIVRETGLASTLPNEAVAEYMKVHSSGPFPKDMAAYWPYLKTNADPVILNKIAELRNRNK